MGRRAIVTGAASGIGRAVAQALVDGGDRVLAVDLEPDPGGPGEPFAADLTTRDGNAGAVSAAVAAFGRLDVVVANAAIPEDRWDAIAFLAGPGGGAFTGVPVTMDLGWSAR